MAYIFRFALSQYSPPFYFAYKRCAKYSADHRRSFHRDIGGNIAMVFAFLSGLLFLFVGGAVDYSRWNAVRADMIESMDAASLAVAQRAASDTSLTDTELKAYGVKFFKENFQYENEVDGFDIDFDLDNAAVISTCVEGALETYLLGVVGISELDIDNCVEVTKQGTGQVELALVLDVTGSMSQYINSTKKMDSLKDGVEELLDVLFGDDSTRENIKIGVVPFNAFVNAGGASSWSSDWEDADAEAYYHGARYFHVDATGSIDMNTKVNHFELFDSTGEAWQGCVEARPYPLDELDIATNATSVSTTDLTDPMTIPSEYSAKSTTYDERNYDAFDDAPSFALTTSTIADTDNLLFVPHFAPDEPDCNNSDDCDDGDYSESGTVSGYSWRGHWFDNPGDDSVNASGTIYLDDYNNRYFIDDYKFINYNQGTAFEKYVPIVYHFREVANPSGSITDSDFKAFLESYGVKTSVNPGYRRQEYIMRTAYVGWYDSTTKTYDYKYDLASDSSVGSDEGPNRHCGDEILPLTNVRGDIQDFVDALSTGGYTNSANGAMWGWRILSSDPPFTEGIGPTDSDFPNWQKAVVIMTDGENTIEPQDTHFDSGLGATGFAIESRMGANMDDRNDMADEIDNKLLRICHRMKEEDYLVYTIMFGLDSDDTELAFRACATEPNAPYFYDAADGTDLEEDFADIAADLVDLHVSK